MFEETKFEKWLNSHQPSDDMLYKDAFWNVYRFWEHKIFPMFIDECYKKPSDFVYNVYQKELDENLDIVGEHRSKSIINPVVRITYKGVKIVFRYNFYNYEIAVISSKPIELPMRNLFFSKDMDFFYQGFPKEYQIKERYEDNNCVFMAHIGDNYRFYTFMFLLQRSISQWEE